MKQVFSKIQKSYAEYEFWKSLSNEDKVNFLFDMYSVQVHASKLIDLTSFFESVRDQLETESTEPELDPEVSKIESVEFDETMADRVDVMIDDSNIMIESNNLKALRAVTFKFVESGYILQRDIIMERLFKRDKLTKYLRIFKIINQAPDLCFN